MSEFIGGKMKNNFFVVLFFFLSINSVQAQSRVLVEIFTNSHCGVCPGAHSALKEYLQNSEHSERIDYIYYHMKYPYQDDPLYHHNTLHSDARDLYYGPFFFTPITFFNGARQPSGNYGLWQNKLDSLAGINSGLAISVSGVRNDDHSNIKINVGVISQNTELDGLMQIIITENVAYQGRNGILIHDNTMRYMLEPEGIYVMISANSTQNFERTFSINQDWNPDSLKVLAFIQSKSDKNVLASGSFRYSDFLITETAETGELPINFVLGQNYPNPFNPDTNIDFSVDETSYTLLEVYNQLGEKIAVLFDGIAVSGRGYSTKFQGEGLSSGIYFYRLQSGSRSKIAKMVLLR